jgi:hypothetical protein
LKAVSWRKRTLVIAAVAVFVLGIGLPVISGAMAAHEGAAAAAAATPAAAVTQAPQAVLQPATLSPHNGTLDVYETVPGGATTLDPAAAYDTTSIEVLFNTYETLVDYNGSATTSFVPTLATCVPDTPQCTLDYGGGFTGTYNSTGGITDGTNHGTPQYWTFVIDPAAHFYDPVTHASWGVYPTDVMFSIARTLGFANIPNPGKTAGWIISQALEQYGQPTFNHGINYPYNNTGANVLGAMLINDTHYCPATAMNGIDGNGCITFNANGTGQLWPEFLDFFEDHAGGSVVSCGWYTYEGASVPGFNGTHKAHGDGSCVLPNGGTTTNTTSWHNYLASLSLNPWNAFESLDYNWPAPQANIQWSIVDSGLYYVAPSGKINVGISYSLEKSPAYKQPSGCSGAIPAIHVYPNSYCDPAPTAFIPKVVVTWETAAQGDSLGANAVLAGTADFAAFEAQHTGEFLSDVHSGLWQYLTATSLNDAFATINLDVDYAKFNSTIAVGQLGANPLPETMMSDYGFRNLFVQSYPFQTIQQTINTQSGIEFSFNAGGPIPVGMGAYYPTNLTYNWQRGNPYQGAGPNNSNNTTAGEAAWWYHQLINPSSPFYNATMVSDCTVGNPCTWPIVYFDGAPIDATLVGDWANALHVVSGGTLSPFAYPVTFTQFLEALVFPSPITSSVGFGWGPDYPDPSDYVTPMGLPGQSYTGPDAFGLEVFTAHHENNATCGFSVPTLGNLSYWAHAATNFNGSLNSTCQGVAYSVATFYNNFAATLGAGPERIALYAQTTQILTALAMYVWQGQTNTIIGSAPWISEPSINTNPIVGAGTIPCWFQVRYVTGVSAVTVSETGLPVGKTWGITVNGVFHNNTTVIKPHTLHTIEGSVKYLEPVGPLVLAPMAQPPGSGSQIVRVTGPLPSHTSYFESNVTHVGTPVALTVWYAANKTLWFNETIVAGYPGLPSGDHFTVTLTPLTAGSNHAAMLSQIGTSTGTSAAVSFVVPDSLTYHFAVSNLPALWTSTPAAGNAAAGIHGHTVLLKFKDPPPPTNGGAMLAIPAKLFDAVSTVGHALSDLALVPVRGGL